MVSGIGPLRASIVERINPGDCWEWTGRIMPPPNGYGTIGGKLAHKVIWELLVGPVPEGLELDHLCRTNHCVKPDHLEPVSHWENMRRGGNSIKSHCKRGHLLSGANLRREPSVTARGYARRCKACHNLNAQRRYWLKRGDLSKVREVARLLAGGDE